jgi:hypothetical protein
MTPIAKEEMLALREDRGWSYARIAATYGVSPAVVSYHCLIAGAEKPGPFPRSYVRPGAIEQRGNHVVRRFTPDEDALILALSLRGMSNGAIGRSCSPRRRPNSIKGRLATLARREARAEAG